MHGDHAAVDDRRAQNPNLRAACTPNNPRSVVRRFHTNFVGLAHRSRVGGGVSAAVARDAEVFDGVLIAEDVRVGLVVVAPPVQHGRDGRRRHQHRQPDPFPDDPQRMADVWPDRARTARVSVPNERLARLELGVGAVT